MRMAPIVNSRSASKITGLRPILSERDPENKEPTAAPISAQDTIISFWKSSMSGNVSTKNSYAPEITPVSYPNRNPPIAAIETSWIMKHILYERPEGSSVVWILFLPIVSWVTLTAFSLL